MLVELAREFPHIGYVKEEYNPVIERMSELVAHRPAIKGIFSGNAGINMLYEMRLGFDGTMPGAPYADLYAQVWNLHQSGERQKARDLFSKLLLMVNLDEQIPGTRQYIRVTGELESPAPYRTIRNCKPPQLNIVFGSDSYCQNRFDAGHPPVKLGPIRGEASRRCALSTANRLRILLRRILTHPHPLRFRPYTVQKSPAPM